MASNFKSRNDVWQMTCEYDSSKHICKYALLPVLLVGKSDHSDKCKIVPHFNQYVHSGTYEASSLADAKRKAKTLLEGGTKENLGTDGKSTLYVFNKTIIGVVMSYESGYKFEVLMSGNTGSMCFSSLYVEAHKTDRSKNCYHALNLDQVVEGTIDLYY